MFLLRKKLKILNQIQCQVMKINNLRMKQINKNKIIYYMKVFLIFQKKI